MAKRKSRRLPQFLDPEQPEQLLHVTDRERDRLICLLLLMCGLRVSEVTKLEIGHLDFKRKVLAIRHGKGDKDRFCPLPKRLVGPLRGWVAGRKSGFVFPGRFGGRLTNRAVQLLLKRLAVKAGLPGASESRKFTPHKLRHAFCVRLLEAGVPIHECRDLMGHSSISATDRYAACSPERLRVAIEAPYS